MIDHDFFKNQGPFTLRALADLCQAELIQCEDPDQEIYSISPLQNAAKRDISCLHNPKYLNYLTSTQAGAIILHPDHVKHAPNTPLLVTPKPYRSYGQIADLFYPAPPPKNQIHPTAQISPSAKLGHTCEIGAFVVIEAEAEIGNEAIIEAHTVIGKGVKVGDYARIGNHVSIHYAHIGHKVHIKPGARIGQKGFGFEMDEQGHFDIPQLGRVIIGDNVEIGANTTIDRGASTDTIIENGTRIDNLVQIAHNVHLGKNCVIVAQVGISGSTKLGNFVIAAGQAGLTGHLTIGDGARIAAQSGVMRDIAPGETVAGSPAIKSIDWKKQIITLNKLIKMKGM
jgi:UDP-3-O-[3-hydroxymyristoyl] glucosamine N-acyltransferase